MTSLPNLPLVIFLDILDQYSYKTDLICKFKFNSEDRVCRKTDFIAIFKLGWTNVTEYVAIKGVPENSKDGLYLTNFSKNVLPSNTADLFQICYINGQNLYGASTPFQFCAENSLNNFNSMDSISRCQSITEKDQEILRLKEENCILRESLKTLLAVKSGSATTSKSYDKDIKEVKESVEAINSLLSVHDKEIKMLKDKIKEGGEENKKLYMEKYKVQKKYDQLKSHCYGKKSLLEDGQPTDDFNLDLGDLKSLPPFPSILKF